MAKEKGIQNPNVKSVSAWTPIEDRHKKRKLVKGEPKTYEQSMEILRDTMQKSCNKGTCTWN